MLTKQPAASANSNTSSSLRRSIASDLSGLCRLSTEAVHHTTALVEAQHTRLDILSNYLFKDRGVDKARNPIAALVYNSIYGINNMVGTSVGFVLDKLEPLLGETTPSVRKEAALAILNGVVGDYLDLASNPLCIQPHWRIGNPLGMVVEGVVEDCGNTEEWIETILQHHQHGQQCHFIILVHGSCNSPHDWCQEGHNHGDALKEDLKENENAIILYWHYNTGLHISHNGQLLAHAMDRLVMAVQGMDIHTAISVSLLAHSMGGLVARSACLCAQSQPQQYDQHHWLQLVTNLICLGSPHHGAILERGGKLVDAVLGAHRFTEPISWVGKIRSKGVTDLGYGNVREEDWKIATGVGDYRQPTPLPSHVRTCAIAAVTGSADSSSYRLLGDTLRGDGLVTQASALGRGHSNPEMNLQWSRETTFFNLGHVGLLSSPDVYREILSCMTEQDDDDDMGEN